MSPSDGTLMAYKKMIEDLPSTMVPSRLIITIFSLFDRQQADDDGLKANRLSPAKRVNAWSCGLQARSQRLFARLNRAFKLMLAGSSLTSCGHKRCDHSLCGPQIRALRPTMITGKLDAHFRMKTILFLSWSVWLDSLLASSSRWALLRSQQTRCPAIRRFFEKEKPALISWCPSSRFIKKEKIWKVWAQMLTSKLTITFHFFFIWCNLLMKEKKAKKKESVFNDGRSLKLNDGHLTLSISFLTFFSSRDWSPDHSFPLIEEEETCDESILYKAFRANLLSSSLFFQSRKEDRQGFIIKFSCFSLSVGGHIVFIFDPVGSASSGRWIQAHQLMIKKKEKFDEVPRHMLHFLSFFWSDGRSHSVPSLRPCEIKEEWK